MGVLVQRSKVMRATAGWASIHICYTRRLLTELGSYDIPRDPRRYMVLEGDVVELCRTSKSGTNTRKLRRLFLFSDIVVCAKPIRNSKNAEMLGDYIYKPKV